MKLAFGFTEKGEERQAHGGACKKGWMGRYSIYGTASYGCYTPKLRAMPTEWTSGVYVPAATIRKSGKNGQVFRLLTGWYEHPLPLLSLA